MDPVEFRRINLMRAGDESPFGKRAPHLEAARVLDRALQDSRYHSPKAVHTGRGVAMAQWFPLGGECYVFVTVDGEGGVTVAAAVVDQGSGVHTVMRQVAAEVLDVELEAVRVEIFDTRRVPADQGLGGSRGTRVYGCAAYEAAVEARRTLFERAAELMDAPVERLSVSQGAVVRADGAGRPRLRGDRARHRFPGIREGPLCRHHHRSGGLRVRADRGGGRRPGDGAGVVAQGHHSPRRGHHHQPAAASGSDRGRHRDGCGVRHDGRDAGRGRQDHRRPPG